MFHGVNLKQGHILASIFFKHISIFPMRNTHTHMLAKLTLIAFIADLVTDIIFARDIGGFMSIMENNWTWRETKNTFS